MEVKIEIKPTAELEFDKAIFEKKLTSNFSDFEGALKASLRLVESKEFDEKLAVEYVLLYNDWGNLLWFYENISNDIIPIRIYRCVINGLVRYKPDTINVEKGIFNFKEDIENNRSDFLVVSTHNPRMDAQIGYLLSKILIDYQNYDWKQLIEHEDINNNNDK